jgi:hypothetical protein
VIEHQKVVRIEFYGISNYEKFGGLRATKSPEIQKKA